MMTKSISQLRRARLSEVQQAARAEGVDIFGSNPALPLDKGRLIAKIQRKRAGEEVNQEEFD